MRKEVVIDNDGMADLRQLSPVTKIWTAFRISFQNTEIFKNRRQRAIEVEYKKRCEVEDNFKSVLLKRIYAELIKNTYMGSKGLHTKDITLAVDRKMEEVLKNIIKHKDFAAYDIKILQPNEDIVKCFPETPILINVRKKLIGGVPVET